MAEKVEREALERVSQCFPEWRAEVHSLMQSSESFQDLCKNYNECLQIIERLRIENEPTDSRLEQYCELRVSLEQELRGRIIRTTPEIH